jgi:hypothetical protein
MNGFIEGSPPDLIPGGPGTSIEESKRLTWDNVGERFYRGGVDKGVLYLQDGRFSVWNGLISVEESSNTESKSFFLDGVKYLENLTPADFVGKLKAFTYPDEFDEVVGIAVVAPGLHVHEQPPKSFSLSYRVRIGNDVEGEELGYQIHILYNIFANPDTVAYATRAENVEASEFGWLLSGVPDKISKLRPAVHISIDSRTTPPEILRLIEAKLYGTDTSSPSLPPLSEIGEYYGYRGALLIIDFGDGTWVAIDESNTYIDMVSPTHFVINGADTTYLDPDTYTISSTDIGEQDA